MVFNLLQCRLDVPGLAMLMVIRRLPGMFMVNNDGVLLSGLCFFDNPEVSCILGLNFIEGVCLADKPEIWGRKKPAFFLGKHHGFPLYPAQNPSAGMYRMASSSYPIF